MSKILAVFGATGQQGGGLIDFVLKDPELSQKFTIRAITRDVASDKAKQLKEKVQVVAGDAQDRASLETALTGVHTVFAMTAPAFEPNGLEIEYNGAKNIADVAVEKGVDYIVFSTLPSVREVSGGKYTKVIHFDSKAKAEKYIRGLPIKSAFYSPGFFMENFKGMHLFAPQKAPDGSWVLPRNCPPETRVPMIDATGDTGKFVGAILAEPDKYKGKTFSASAAEYTWVETAAALSKSTGQKITFKQISDEEFAAMVPGAGDIFVEALNYGKEFGHYGPDSKKLIAWAVENARGKPTGLDEFFKAHPYQL